MSADTPDCPCPPVPCKCLLSISWPLRPLCPGSLCSLMIFSNLPIVLFSTAVSIRLFHRSLWPLPAPTIVKSVFHNSLTTGVAPDHRWHLWARVGNRAHLEASTPAADGSQSGWRSLSSYLVQMLMASLFIL